jgi:hypothetical protein
VIKENHYNGPSYCFDPDFCPSDRNASHPANPEAYFITQLSPRLDGVAVPGHQRPELCP